MSSFLVSDDVVNRIISACADPQLEFYFASCFGRKGLDFNTTDGGLVRLGYALFDLNIKGVNSKYGEGSAESFRPLNYVPGLSKSGVLDLSDLEAAVDELSYQCAEYPATELPLFSALADFCKLIRPLAKQQRAEEEQRVAKERSLYVANRIAAGELWLLKNRPAWAKAAIVAEYHVSESDSYTDYWGSRIDRYVLLAWSKHNRNLFPEMRKAAALFGETEFLATADASAEHRQNWSMGGGMFLSTVGRYSTGWQVNKCAADNWNLRYVCGELSSILPYLGGTAGLETERKE